MLVAWAAAALAVLSKGLIGIVLPGGALALYILVAARLETPGAAAHRHRHAAVPRDRRTLVRRRVRRERRSSSTSSSSTSTFERFLTKAHGRYQPAWYFIPILLIGFSPWILSLAPALARAWRQPRTGPGAQPEPEFRPARFLLIWSAMVFVFFSASSSKLPSYILPIFPALAVLVALHAASAGRALLAAQARTVRCAGAGDGAVRTARSAGRGRPNCPHELLSQYVPWIMAAGLAMLVLSAASAYFAWQRQTAAAVIFLAAGGLRSSPRLLLGHETLSPAYSAYHIAEKIRPGLKADVPFYTVNTFDHTLPFYLGRTVTMVAYKDELGPAIGWEPENFIPDLAAFARAWQADREALALCSTPTTSTKCSKALPMPMQVVARDPRRVVVEESHERGQPSRC